MDKSKISLAEESDKLRINCEEVKTTDHRIWDVGPTIKEFGRQPIFTQILLVVPFVCVAIVFVVVF